MLTNIINLSLLSLLLPITAYAGHGNPLLNRHHELAKRADGHVDLFHRAAGARMSYYNVQTGNALVHSDPNSVLFQSLIDFWSVEGLVESFTLTVISYVFSQQP